jgi:DNA-directed RNA polymerase subunit alpha
MTEFSAIPHVREDMTRLILNVKDIPFPSPDRRSVRIHIEIVNEGPVTAGDLSCPPDVIC